MDHMNRNRLGDDGNIHQGILKLSFILIFPQRVGSTHGNKEMKLKLISVDREHFSLFLN